MRAKHKNAIATLRRGHPEETAEHTHNHCALSQLRGVGCVKKRMLTHVRRKRREHKASPRSRLLLEMQTVQALQLLDEGLFDRLIEFLSPRLQVSRPSLVSA